jgi:hypothetical protein
MNLFKKQITSPDSDSIVLAVIGGACLGVAVLPPYNRHTVYFAPLAAGNIFNAWRLRRKIAVSKDSQSHLDSN